MRSTPVRRVRRKQSRQKASAVTSHFVRTTGQKNAKRAPTICTKNEEEILLFSLRKRTNYSREVFCLRMCRVKYCHSSNCIDEPVWRVIVRFPPFFCFCFGRNIIS